MRWIIFLFFTFIIAVSGTTQTNYSLGLGTIYGGAIGSKKINNAEGKPLFGAILNLGCTFLVSQKFIFTPVLSHEFRHFEYSAFKRSDTTVLVDVLGTPAYVPTWYYANIHGKTSSVGTTLNLMGEYRFTKRSSAVFGLYSTFFLCKKNHGGVNIRIGEGGLLPDADSSFNKTSSLRNFEHGLSLGGKMFLNDFISFGITGTRSLTDLYKNSGTPDNQGKSIKFYSTYMKLYLTWYFERKTPGF